MGLEGGWGARHSPPSWWDQASKVSRKAATFSHSQIPAGSPPSSTPGKLRHSHGTGLGLPGKGQGFLLPQARVLPVQGQRELCLEGTLQDPGSVLPQLHAWCCPRPHRSHPGTNSAGTGTRQLPHTKAGEAVGVCARAGGPLIPSCPAEGNRDRAGRAGAAPPCFSSSGKTNRSRQVGAINHREDLH